MPLDVFQIGTLPMNGYAAPPPIGMTTVASQPLKAQAAERHDEQERHGTGEDVRDDWLENNLCVFRDLPCGRPHSPYPCVGLNFGTHRRMCPHVGKEDRVPAIFSQPRFVLETYACSVVRGLEGAEAVQTDAQERGRGYNVEDDPARPASALRHPAHQVADVCHATATERQTRLLLYIIRVEHDRKISQCTPEPPPS